MPILLTDESAPSPIAPPELPVIKSVMSDVHDHVVGQVRGVVDPFGYLSRENRTALDRRIRDHLWDLRYAIRLGYLSISDAEQAASDLVRGIGDTAPKEQELAEDFTRNCVLLAQEVDAGLKISDPSSAETESLKYQTLILREKQKSAIGGAIVHHLGIFVPDAHIIVPTLQLASQRVSVS